jgi:hypothetical protein
MRMTAIVLAGCQSVSATHPSQATRISDLNGYSAKVMPLYEAARAKR